MRNLAKFPSASLFAAAFSAALLLSPALSAQDSPSVDEILKKHVEARGGMDKLKAIQSMKITGKVVIGGGQMEAPMTLQVKRPNESRMEMSIQGKSLIQAFDGTTAWMMNPFQGATEAEKSSEDDTKAAVDDADFDGVLIDPKGKGHTVELVGKEDIEGSPAYKLKITKKTGNVEYDYLDAQTFLPVKVTAKRKQMGQEMEIDSYPANYKPVNGVMTPFVMDQKVGGKSLMQMVIEKVEPNVTIDEAVFKMPAKKEEAKDKK